ncbi:hypothetical protein ACS0TY_018228 [Phlomoides rotata]
MDQRGLGFVIHNETGRVTLAGMKCMKAIGNNTLLEALALRFGLKKALEHNVKGLLTESDSQNLVMAL